MGIWVIFHRSELYRIVLICVLFYSINAEPGFVQKLEVFFRNSGAYVKTLKDVFGTTHNKRDPLINNFISASLQRAGRDTLIRKPNEASNIFSLNIEADDTDSTTIKNVHTIRAKYDKNQNISSSDDNLSHFQPKWRERVIVERNKHVLTTHAPELTAGIEKFINMSEKKDTNRLLSNHSNTYIDDNNVNGSLLANFLKPTEKSIDSFISNFAADTTNNVGSQDDFTLNVDPLAENRETPKSKSEISNNISKSPNVSSNSIFSFFAEENKRPVNEIEEFNAMDDGEDDFDSDSHVLTHHHIPILSGLIHGTLNEDMEAKNEQFREYVDNLRNFNYADNTTSNNDTVSIKPDTRTLPQNLKIDLEDPDSIDQENATNLRSKANSVPSLMESLIKTTVPTERDIFSYNFHGQNNSSFPKKMSRPKINENKIEFFQLKPNNSTKTGYCMDGTPPGYYFRRGVNDRSNKWIIHLHGGAWCYDLKSCMKRRNSILGSTNSSVLEDINSFFHGILSKNSNSNPNFYDWNVVVLSYCDGGLFSGNRRRPLTGKGKSFFFQGRVILKSLLQRIRDTLIEQVSEVVLSGTSAGGLAVVLQGDFIRQFFPSDVKIRGLVDAGVFLDQQSLLGDSIVRQQFRALYSLHKPVLNKDCLANVPKREKYTCLFPEKAMPYMELPVFVVNSLYDHWQLSYLQGINCVLDSKKCDTGQHDRILQFRNHMFTALKNISEVKNDTGIFANSCFAHGQVIIDYTWTKININSRSISQSFYDWYNDENIDRNKKKHLLVDCKYPCNGSCAKLLADKCVSNFKAASERRRKRSAELC